MQPGFLLEMVTLLKVFHRSDIYLTVSYTRLPTRKQLQVLKIK